ncbi:MAG: bifunctional UDP-N-acetylglucosamine diphosphorylase/glucosamine-1-phosphate N-acetyltransferase GlmU [Armatimonadota bacterium]|nr:bifunctional UDP-N-acetylglucosamine diphosphorylase/glucosamine-1-phosphate N-acetyltransferase GlmU [Armatimonadota bacterium]MDR5704383.1 bifunctional UDP-N-acetylglucosamine diphosphorylase/glucosamine-1-phosphate N-acetyltransferase GlmU [Armatimonadota bacterium]MDR7435191.1 bifunctional UDP-N-acetylglucosamine diphosphorylase/glucosamine-1-phosphate N-acetyltransferase GlmU [Armatimonadota bacterium]
MERKAIVLAAGEGKRMRSPLPKVLHPLCGRPMVGYVLDALEGVGIPNPIVVVGHGANLVKEAIGERGTFVEQPQPLGTGHAVQVASSLLEGFSGTVLVLYGDVPLVTAATLEELASRHEELRAAATIAVSVVEDPTGYGRVIRGRDGRVERIVEEGDCTPEERRIREINAGIYAFSAQELLEALPHLQRDNVQGEYYLTDAVSWLIRHGRLVASIEVNAQEALGVNSRRELSRAEEVMRQRILDRLMDQGVTVVDPRTTYVHATAVVGEETILHPFTVIEGDTTIGRACVIGPFAHLRGARIADRVRILSSTVEESEIGEGTTIGPYAHLRPGNVIGRFVEIGNYAEMKNARVGDYTKVHHMSYLGDATVGSRVNIGAGTITCNFDGKRKHPTTIEEGAFIGSDTMLIAPVRVGKGAMTGAGSVVNKDVPPRGVAVGVPARVIRYLPEEES